MVKVSQPRVGLKQPHIQQSAGKLLPKQGSHHGLHSATRPAQLGSRKRTSREGRPGGTHRGSAQPPGPGGDCRHGVRSPTPCEHPALPPAVWHNTGRAGPGPAAQGAAVPLTAATPTRSPAQIRQCRRSRPRRPATHTGRARPACWRCRGRTCPPRAGSSPGSPPRSSSATWTWPERDTYRHTVRRAVPARHDDTARGPLPPRGPARCPDPPPRDPTPTHGAVQRRRVEAAVAVTGRGPAAARAHPGRPLS